MTDAVKIYHNPRCSKSRDTLSLLKSNGVEPEVVLLCWQWDFQPNRWPRLPSCL